MSANAATSIFAARLKQAQSEAELNNEALARMVGVPVRLLQVWRAGTSTPGGENLARLTVALKQDAAWFFSEPESTSEAA